MYKSPFSPEVIGWNYLALFIEGIAALILVILLEFRWSINSFRQKYIFWSSSSFAA